MADSPFLAALILARSRAWGGAFPFGGMARQAAEALDAVRPSLLERAYLSKSSDQAAIGTSATQVTGWSLVSTVGNFSLASDQLTVPSAGDYLITVTVIFTGLVSPASARLDLRNGSGASRYHASWVTSDGAGISGCSLAGVVQLSSDLTLSLYANTSAGTMTLSAGTTMNVKWSVVKLG
jgi:hypothetical protein